MPKSFNNVNFSKLSFSCKYTGHDRHSNKKVIAQVKYTFDLLWAGAASKCIKLHHHTNIMVKESYSAKPKQTT